MQNPKIRIDSDGEKSELYINGKLVERVSRIQFDNFGGSRPECSYERNAFGESVLESAFAEKE